MKAEQYLSQVTAVAGQKLGVTSYKVGSMYHCVIDNVNPGAWIARARGFTRDEAEGRAMSEALHRLADRFES